MKNFLRTVGVGLAFTAVFVVAATLASPAAYAQFILVQSGSFGGCDDSPENRTLILAAIAGIGFACNELRRYRSRIRRLKAVERDALVEANDLDHKR